MDAGIKPRIESCSLSGLGRRVLVDLSDQYPSILELDVKTQALYWNDKNTKQLFTARMDGSSMKVLKSGIPHITGIFIEGLYGLHHIEKPRNAATLLMLFSNITYSF